MNEANQTNKNPTDKTMKTYLSKHWLIFFAFAVLSGSPARAQAGPGSALNFDGASGYAQVANGVWFNGNFTVEAWVYVRSYNNWSRLIDFGDGTNNMNVYLALSAGTTGFPAMGIFTNTGVPVLQANTQLPLNQWAHLACTLSNTTGTIYINGNNVGTLTLNVPPGVLRTNNYVGRSFFGADGYANALFDEVRIWNVARTQGQLQAYMHRSLVGNEAGLAGYWRMDEASGTTLNDSSGHGQTATSIGGTTWTNSTAPIISGAGSALNFNAGASQLVSIPHQPALNAYPLTVMTWFKTTNVNGALVNKYVSSSFNGYQIFMSGGHLQGWYFRDPVNNVYNGGPMDAGLVNDGLWHHAAMAIDATGGRLYLDGVLKSSLPWSGTAGPVTTTLALSLGVYQGDSFWNGQLDQVSVWNTALSSSQIQTNMNRPLLGTENGLLGYWRLDEGSGTNTVDASTNGRNATLFGNPTWVASGAGVVAPDPGYALSLTSTNSEYIQVPNGVWFSNDFTVEGWVYCRSYNNWSRLFDFGNAGYLQEVYMALSGGTGGFPTMGIFTNGNNNLVSSSQLLPLNQWTHLATTLSGSTATIYMNGNAVGSGTVLVPGNFVRTNNYFGRSLFGGDAYANATFDELRIWNVARSATQIQQTMNSPLKGSEPNLIGYWRLDEGAGTNSVDATGNGNNAFLFGGATKPLWVLSGALVTNSTVPLVNTQPATNVAATSATLNGTVNPAGQAAGAWFQWGTNTSYGSNTPMITLAAATTNMAVSSVVTGLTALTTYHFRVAATNYFGTNFGADLTFTTQLDTPTVTTLPATNILTTAATLNASVNPGGNAGVYFLWGPTTNYGNATITTNLIGGSAVAVSKAISGLAPGATYHFQAVATNAAGTNFGGDQSFSASMFVQNNAGLTEPIDYSVSEAFGDFNNDGKLDLLQEGDLWVNNGSGNFSQLNGVGPGRTSSFGSSAWFDLDNDGRLDFLVSWNTSDCCSLLPHTQFWHNNGSGNFSLMSATGVPDLMFSTAVVGDFDNDGRQDLLYMGATHNLTDNGGIYRNNGDGTFGFITIPGLIAVHSGGIAVGDFDNDGYLDFVIVGATRTSQDSHVPTFQMWHNNGNGTFSRVQVPGAVPMGPHGDRCYAAVGDINNDGYLDFLISGPRADGVILTQVWLNNGNMTFTLANTLPGVTQGTLALADFDNDGVLDIFLTGLSVGSPRTGLTAVWKGLGNGQFSVLSSNFPLMSYGFGAVADMNNDGRLDFLFGGLTVNNTGPISLYLEQNVCPVTNTPPSAPSNLQVANIFRNSISLSWNPASDAQTPASALNYNIRIGTNSGGIQIAAPNSDLTTGFRRVPGWGNSHTPSAKFTLLPGHYYWSVQTIDSAWAGSPFSSEGQFTLGIPTAVTQPAAPVTSSTAVLNGLVDAMGGPTAVWFQWGTTTNYGNNTPITMLSGTNSSAEVVPNLLTGLSLGVYHFRVVASNNAATTYGGDMSFSVALFTNVASSLPPVYFSSIAWGDFNNDGLLDLLVTGATNGSVSDGISQIWQNLGNGSFSNINISLPGVSASSVAWADFDNDGFLDILLTGTDTTGNGLSQVWHNNGDGTFTLTSSGLPGVGSSSVAVADFDNDGRLDILLTGSSSSGRISQVWRNQGDGTFASMNVPLPGVNFGSVACNDFDKDGNVDILLTGVGASGRLTQLWRNNGTGSFSLINAGLPAVRESSVAWADFDNDGYPDIVLTGGALAQVWRNNHDGTFTNLNVGLPNVAYSSVAVADFDNDGLQDILLSGTVDSTGPGSLTRLFRNLGNGSFTNTPINLPGAWIGASAWGDFDNDGRLDFLMTGWDTNSNPTTLLWQNLNTQTNNAPAAPTGIAATAGSSGGMLSWTAGTDAQTPAPGLTYNVRVGTNSGGGQILSSESSVDGFRRVVQPGNAQQRLGITLRGLTPGTAYYWSVQSVDSSFAGSPFSAEGTFIVGAPGVVTGPSLIASATSEQLTGSVNPNGLDSTAWFEWGTNTTYGSNTDFVPISGAISSAVGITNLLSGLTPGTVYHYRLVATNALGINRGRDSAFTVPLAPSVTTLAATAVVPTSALLNGTVLPNNAPTLAWFQWGTSTSYGSTSAPISLSMTNLSAVALSNLLTSLIPNTQYHFLLSASNIAGLGSGGDLTFTTPAPSAPSVTSLPADGITPNRATLHGTAAPNGAATAAWFQWGLTPSYGNNSALFPIDATNLSASALSYSLSGLAGGTVYYYRLAATNSAGTNFGAGLSLTTLPVTAPTATTLAASAVTSTAATLNGTANPNGADTLAWFQYGANTSYGSVTPGVLVSSNLSASASLSNSVIGLVAGVVYHFQLVASNSVGVALGSDLTFLPPLFTSTQSGLPNLLYSSAAWGDFDNDGHLDVLLSGYDGTNVVSQVWRNLGNGSFSNINVGLPGLYAGAVAWSDYDNDGHLDVLLTGADIANNLATQLWHNNGNGTFTRNTNNALPGLYFAAVAWGDYDNDGKPDLFLTGANAASAPVSQLWHNDGNGSFSLNTNVTFAQVFGSAVAWGDYDNDGRLDLLLAGATTGAPVTQLWHNDGNGVFSLNTNAPLPAVYFASVAWGDYDNDGRLDILLTGNDGSSPLTQVWHNDGNGVFTLNSPAALPAAYEGSAAWGDYDGDGKLDILLSGLNNSDNPLTQIWRNNGNGTFSAVNVAMPSIFAGAAVWADVDNNGKLDLLLTGASSNSGGPNAPLTALFSNSGPLSNTPPAAPSGLTATPQSSGQMRLSWNPATDPQTPASGLNYNLRIGTTPGGSDVLAPDATLANGFRRLPQLGNAQEALTNIVTHLSAGTYYWSVQAVDTSFAGGPFAPESTFIVTASTPPILTGATLLPNGAFQFSFTNQGASFTVLSSTNISLPLSNWTVLGSPSNVAPGVFQFTTSPATNDARRFFRVRSP